MRPTLVLASCCLALSTAAVAGRPLDVHVHAYRHLYRQRPLITAYLVRHGLLSPEQAACASVLPAPHGSRRVAHVSVYENFGGRCPGAPQPPAFLFDVYVDTVSGVVDTTPETRDELQTVL